MNTTNPLSQALLRLETLELEANRTATRLASAERRIRVTWTLATLAVLGSFVLGANKESLAQGYGVTLAQLLSRVISLETKTASINTLTDPNTGMPTVRFEGVNVQVVNGTGETQSAPNGVGNLIIGYNELRGSATDARSGSHNLVIGFQNSYSSLGGMVVGNTNTTSGLFACVSGGANNTASGVFAQVAGGLTNTASGQGSVVAGGFSNTATGVSNAIAGGRLGTTSGVAASLIGGSGNQATGTDATVSGGQNNIASGLASSVSGGLAHTSSNPFNWRAGTLLQDK